MRLTKSAALRPILFAKHVLEQPPMSFQTITQTIRATGVGEAAVEGAWWGCATEPVEMSSAEFNQLTQIGNAIFALTDAVADELHENPTGAFAQRLREKVPAHLAQTLNLAPVLMCRPDFQLVPTVDGLQFVLTEIEIAPFSEGCAHAMQVAYDVEADTVPTFAHMLNGRELLFVGTHEWNRYIYDQLAFCKALAAQGARAAVLYNQTVAEMETAIQNGTSWRDLLKGGDAPSMTDHIARHNFAPFLRDEWPASVGDAVIFRFGYVEHFTPAQHALFRRWEAQGATFLNPFSFHLDSKVLLEGVHTAAIRQRLCAQTVAALERCIPETHLLTSDNLARFVAEKDTWLIKFAGFDETNTAWGGRSVRFGRDFSAEKWHQTLQNANQLNWPVVAQRLAVSQQLTLDYYRPDGTTTTQHNGYTRQRTFFVRANANTPATHCGSHITLNNSMNVSEGSPDAIQAPIRFVR